MRRAVFAAFKVTCCRSLVIILVSPAIPLTGGFIQAKVFKLDKAQHSKNLDKVKVRAYKTGRKKQIERNMITTFEMMKPVF
jgi:hypothetical protein